MATKTDFSATEWETLRDAPHAVVLAVAAAGASGLFGSIKEAIAPAGTLVEALHGENELLRQICEKEEIKAAIESLEGDGEIERRLQEYSSRLSQGSHRKVPCRTRSSQAQGDSGGCRGFQRLSAETRRKSR